ncbi:BspA family leucine-rich repeat surface protein [Lacticaseibacillus mingshuiensis]|uniref:BspA family leucine-rich repeat surface protein n=1 Tax=Lacticaseibacillus mingshuiensis TaxID=2799574 RepID=UPI0019408097|nr:BspA family leucine-rich repeat surface protein [Lacticaseibacillus mingshuiensis]
MTQGQYRCDQKRNYKKKRFDEQTHKWVTVVALLAIGTTAGVVAQTPISGTNVQTVRAADADSDGHYSLTYTDPSTDTSSLVQDVAVSGQPGTVISDAANDTYSAANINTAAGALGSGDLASYVLADDPFGENPLPAMTITADTSDNQVLQLQKVVAKGIWGTCHWYIDTDNVLHIGPGTGTDTSAAVSPWTPYMATVTKISIDGKVTFPAIADYLFGSLYSNPNWAQLTTITGLANVDTSQTTSFVGTFKFDLKLTSIDDLSEWNTSHVTTFANMFADTGSILTPFEMDLSDWQTGSATSLNSMFDHCYASDLGSLDNWDTSHVTDMTNLFSYAQSLTNIGKLTNWQVGNVTTMSGMFNIANKLTDIGDLSGWDVSKVTNMNTAFGSMTRIGSLGDLGSWNTSSVTNMTAMFGGTSVASLGDISHWDVSHVTVMSAMFSGMPNLTVLDLSGWDTRSVSAPTSPTGSSFNFFTPDTSPLTSSIASGLQQVTFGPNFTLVPYLPNPTTDGSDNTVLEKNTGYPLIMVRWIIRRGSPIYQIQNGLSQCIPVPSIPVFPALMSWPPLRIPRR